jgi:excisionase family DNA binding protein
MTNPARPTPSNARLLLTVEEAADMLNISRTTVYGLLRDGILKAVHIGRSVRLPHAELVRYVEALCAHRTMQDEPPTAPTPIVRRATRTATPTQAELFGLQDPAHPQAG